MNHDIEKVFFRHVMNGFRWFGNGADKSDNFGAVIQPIRLKQRRKKEMRNIVSVGEVKRALNIDSFRNLSKDKIIEFVSLIPNMDKDVAIKVIEQFPEYANFATGMIAQLNSLCDNALKSNSESQKDVIQAYKQILDSLSELLKKEDMAVEERCAITDKMIMVADKISAKDTENKAFLMSLIKKTAPYFGAGLLTLAAMIFGPKIKDMRIPRLKS